MQISQNKSGFTMIDHITLDCVLPTLSASAQLVLIRIYRQTVGWKKEWDRISLSQFRKFTGYKDNGTIAEAISELETRKLIIVEREGTKTNSYSICWKSILACGKIR